MSPQLPENIRSDFRRDVSLEDFQLYFSRLAGGEQRSERRPHDLRRRLHLLQGGNARFARRRTARCVCQPRRRETPRPLLEVAGTYNLEGTAKRVKEMFKEAGLL